MGTHTLKLLVDDSKIRELETRLGKSVGGKQEGSMRNIFGANAGKNLAKLGIIAAGVGSTVAVLDKILKISTESSAHFQATFKLWDSAVRLILRPIGDTIGLVLRPFALMMIKWAVPFYREFLGKTDEILSGAEELGKGNIGTGTGMIGGALIDTLFGEGAGDNFRSNAEGWQLLMDKAREFLEFVNNPFPEAGAVEDELGEVNASLLTFNQYLEAMRGQLDQTGQAQNDFIGYIIQIGEEIRRRMTLEGIPDEGVIGGGGRKDFGKGSAHKHFGKVISSKTETARKLYERWSRIGLSETKIMSELEERGLPTNIFGDPNIGGKKPSGMTINSNIRVEGAVDEGVMKKIAEQNKRQIQEELKKFSGRFG